MPSLNKESVGEVIGPYKLLQQLGEGGMGSVWMAQQEHPVKRRVALKLIKPGFGSREVLSRFDAERQALAMMSHPNIARILDAGTTETGQPWFVMELVTGTPLTTYCDKNRLSVDERLKLFTDVCAGVQHAHQKGIIHRDLKPGNIIVGMQDGKPIPKIIDFGLAKAMEHMNQLTDQSLFTGIGQILGTLKYMSPEQASLDSIDIDTRTDIYALGIILYELLTGSTPLDDSSMKGQAVLKVLEVIRDKEPIKPSSRLSSSTAEQKSSITGERRTDSVRLNRVLAGDLDWIVMKALEKDRTRRYESASGFAADVQRYLNNEPVTARPPSLNYRIGKFVRKNRAGVLAASLLAGALLAGIVGTSWGMVVANRSANSERIAKEAESIALANETQQRKLAEESKSAALVAAERERTAKEQAQQRLVQIEKSNEILGSIFEDLDIQAVKEGTEPLEAVLAKRLVAAGEQLEGESIGDPLAVASLQNRLGLSLGSLGYARDAIKLCLGAFNTRKSELGADHPNTLLSMNNLASAYQAAGELDKALPLFEQTLEMQKAILGADHPNTLLSMNNLASAYQDAGELKQALPLYEQTLEQRKAKLGADHPDTLASMNNLAHAYQAAGELDKALPLFEQTLEMTKAKLGADHPGTLTSMHNLAGAYFGAGELEKAMTLYKQTMETRKAKLGADHPDTLTSMTNLAMAYSSARSPEKSVPLLEETLRLSKQKLGDGHPYTLRTLAFLGVYYREDGRINEAIVALEEVVAKTTKFPWLAWTRRELRQTYAVGNRRENFATMAKEDLKKARELHENGSLELSGELADLGYYWLTIGDPVAAEPLLRECLQIRQQEIPEEWWVFNTQALLGASLVGQEKWDEAKPLLESGYAGLKATVETIPAIDRGKSLTQALDSLIALATATKDADGLKKWTAERATYERDKPAKPETAASNHAEDKRKPGLFDD